MGNEKFIEIDFCLDNSFPIFFHQDKVIEKNSWKGEINQSHVLLENLLVRIASTTNNEVEKKRMF